LCRAFCRPQKHNFGVFGRRESFHGLAKDVRFVGEFSMGGDTVWVLRPPEDSDNFTMSFVVVTFLNVTRQRAAAAAHILVKHLSMDSGV